MKKLIAAFLSYAFNVPVTVLHSYNLMQISEIYSKKLFQLLRKNTIPKMATRCRAVTAT